MSKIVGIDLGTTNSLVATVDSGIPLVIADSEGRRLTPSVVHVPGPAAAPMVGLLQTAFAPPGPRKPFIPSNDSLAAAAWTWQARSCW